MAGPFTQSPSDLLGAAEELSELSDTAKVLRDRALTGRLVRVLRAYVFEGPWEEVRDQLALSQPPDSVRLVRGRFCGSAYSTTSERDTTITCHQGLIEDLGPAAPSPEPVSKVVP